MYSFHWWYPSRNFTVAHVTLAVTACFDNYSVCGMSLAVHWYLVYCLIPALCSQLPITIKYVYIFLVQMIFLDVKLVPNKSWSHTKSAHLTQLQSLESGGELCGGDHQRWVHGCSSSCARFRNSNSVWVTLVEEGLRTPVEDAGANGANGDSNKKGDEIVQKAQSVCVRLGS